MITIRLTRVGRRNQPFFRIVVTEKRRSTRSKVLEIVGSFNPRDRAKSLVLKEERILHWITRGARVSDTVHNMLVSRGVTPKILKKKKGAAEAVPVKFQGSA